jgi:Peptidase family M28/PA domain
MRQGLARSVLVALAGLLMLAGTASAGGKHDDSRELRKDVTTKGILAHELAFQGIASFTGGNRLSGTRGYDGSAFYVGQRAARAGLRVSKHEFSYPLDLLADFTPPVLRVVSGGKPRRFVPGIGGAQFGGDFGSMYGSTSTDFTAPVWAIDLNLPAPPGANHNTSGCEASDYDGMPDGAIALVQRGTCLFDTKFALAEASGAGGVIFFNEGNPGDPTRQVPLWFDVTGLQTPFMASSVETATALANGKQNGFTGLRARFKIDWRPGMYPTSNVIAETRGGDPNNVIVVGAHLDSVGTGPGINDNGSGSSTILEIAEEIRKLKLRQKVRFIWFGAEESGLLGSEEYVESLPPEERDKIAAMLNFDMVGSPNFVRFVYDGDNSAFPPVPNEVEVGPPGSGEIEDLFLDYFASQRLATAPTPFNGRSDYGPFIAEGIPAGGLFTGAEGIKSDEEAAIFGGTADEQYDPCYHLGCDDITNLSIRALDQMSDAAAHATITLAQTRDLPGEDSAPVQQRLGRSGAQAPHDLVRPPVPGDTR